MVTRTGKARMPEQGSVFCRHLVWNWATTETGQRASLVIKVQSSLMH